MTDVSRTKVREIDPVFKTAVDGLVESLASGEVGQKQIQKFIKTANANLCLYLLQQITERLDGKMWTDRRERLENALKYAIYYANKTHSVEVYKDFNVQFKSR